MDKVLNWLRENFDVLFSGLGVYVIGLIVTGIVAILGYLFFRTKATSNNVSMTYVKAGGDVVGRDKKGS